MQSAVLTCKEHPSQTSQIMCVPLTQTLQRNQTDVKNLRKTIQKPLMLTQMMRWWWFYSRPPHTAYTNVCPKPSSVLWLTVHLSRDTRGESHRQNRDWRCHTWFQDLILKPLQHSSWESVNWQINFFYRNTYSATSKLTSGNLFVLLSQRINSHYFVPCYVTITSVKLKFSFLVVVVSLVFSWISWSNKPQISSATTKEDVGKQGTKQREQDLSFQQQQR